MTGLPDPAQVITVTLGDKTFRAGRRTAAHLRWTIERLAVHHPKAHLHIIQPCFNDTIEASKGTHDKDGVLDVRIDGMSWLNAQWFLRQHGWAAWWRHTGSWAAVGDWHIHMASLGCPGVVGYLIDGGLSMYGKVVASSQLADYRNHLDGLASHAPDPTPFPKDISATLFDYRHWWENNLPRVSLARVRKAATTPAWRWFLDRKTARDSKIVRRALKAEGCTYYAQWERRRGVDAKAIDGIPNMATLSALGKRHDFRVNP